MLYNIINNVRLICVKSISKANSGHPGMPLGICDIFVFFFLIFYKINFNNIKSINKDKLIMSNGHGAIINYVLLYLNNVYKLKDLFNFRKIFSKTPGHPEIGKFIDASTGPLGQGIGIGIGIGLKNKKYKDKFNKLFNLFNNKIWIFCGDGCLMEGVSTESCSFCGSYNINNIILLYDSNNISIDGIIKNYFFENIKLKFISLNWNVIGPINGHCYLSIIKSLLKAKNSYFPTIIIYNTIIGFISPCKSYDKNSHGNVFKSLEYYNILKNYSLNYNYFKKNFFDNKKKYLIYYKIKFKKYFFELIRVFNNIIIKINFLKLYFKYYKINLNKSTRFICSNILKNIYVLNETFGGSADLTSSNLTKNNLINSINYKKFKNKYINYGVREFSMGLINYGLSSDKIGINYCSTFLVFSNYMYSIIRNFCLSKLKNIFIFTHDSIFVGEDGPSHQPIEQLQSIRIIPRNYIYRPYNYIELIFCWLIILKLSKNCSSLILSRQNFQNNFIKIYNIKNIITGIYYCFYNNKKIDLIIVSNGSDLEICFECYKFLKKYFFIQIISLFCNKLFEKQKKIYKKKFFNCKKIIFVESSNDDFWYKYKKYFTFILNIKKFGYSGNELEIKKKTNLNKNFLLKLCLYVINI
ncbi:transketolase-like TK C-terminal-containing protein [Candidatus Carsonella ruddii]|uniref:Transketolase n=1 Tax=Candidatus Carsonella ruddii PC isolate NHV TaxID=1202540 RepID=J3TWF8_CARRU|nr:transketolase [Candidatus Carsonella ruddii]AFP84240.1 transketolase [Candidatus Carsonella ruddii PC isolate NHV]